MVPHRRQSLGIRGLRTHRGGAAAAASAARYRHSIGAQRARPPGVSPDNPVIDQLVQGTEVSIYEEQPVSGVPWYRIGTNRWVHSAYVRLIQLEAARDVLTAPGAPADAAQLPLGWVVASSINVRARPGVSAGNPVIGEVFHNQRLDILESTMVSGARWYRIGVDRWVVGQWVAVATAKPRPASIRANERWVGVNLSQQTFVAYEGDTPVYAGMVATGLPATPTVQGVFRTWLRRPGGRMSGRQRVHGWLLLPGGSHLDLFLLFRLRPAHGLLA